jgi:hypothetical protein
MNEACAVIDVIKKTNTISFSHNCNFILAIKTGKNTHLNDDLCS